MSPLSFLNLLIDQVFPEKCPFCLENNNQLRKPLCEACLEQIEFTTSKQRCGTCGDPLGQKACSCEQRDFFFNRFFSIWLYDRQGRALLKQAKFNERISAIRHIKNNVPDAIWEMLEALENAVMLILPSSHTFLENIAKFLAHESDLPIHSVYYKRSKSLQSKMMHEKERFLQIEKNLVIDVKKFTHVKNKNYSHFLLVDDIWTSGSTMNFAAKLLSEQGVPKKDITTLSLLRRDKNQLN